MPYPLRAIITLLIALQICSAVSVAQPAKPGSDSSLLSKAGVDLPYLNSDRKLCADLYTATFGKGSFSLTLSFYKYSAKGDSILLCRSVTASQKVAAGAQVTKIDFASRPKATGDSVWYLPVFYKVLQKTGAVVPGGYKAFLSIKQVPEAGENGSVVVPGNKAQNFAFTYQIDSTLSLFSPIRKELNATLVPDQSTGLAGKLFSSEIKTLHSTATTAGSAIERSTHKIDRLLKTRGLSQQVHKVGEKEVINLYYEDWFVGRYETEAGKSISAQVQQQKAQLTGGITSSANNELTGYRSLLSQVKDISRQKKEDKELRGQIGVTGNFSNGQPEYSALDQNYYELHGSLETEVMDIPVSIEGMYTSQDAHRSIKSSYVHFHYDADKAKEKLMSLISGYKGAYSNTVAKGKGLEQVYGSYLANLKDNKGALLNSLKKETGVSGLDGRSLNSDALKAQIKSGLEAKLAAAVKDTATLLNSAEGSVDSTGRTRAAVAKAQATQVRAKMIEDSVEHLYQKAMQRYEQVLALEKKIEKYEGLIAQYNNTAYFDSALAYSKVQNLKNGDATTYKQLAKSASGLLPEGKAKSFITGLTSLDAGIFPKYVSKYTMAGQQLKGLDAGYDIGFAQVGLTLGKTEYAGRDGTLDKYTTYGARIQCTPLKEQKVGLVYYGYTPSKSAFNSDKDFYKNLDIALPTFRQPVHIVSTTYEGVIAKNVHVDGEAATSFRNDGTRTFQTGFNADRLAWHLTADGNIPKTGLALTGSYEHGGKDFQNSTLPVILAGTDLYKAGVKGELLNGFLTYGVEYNHMQQSSFYSIGGNNRWGFSIATHSKQYPSLSLSYKPFETFRSAVDTFTVPQRPLLGAVWNGKAAYQIKRRGGISWRFSAVYNKSTSKSDSISYASDLIQLNVIYSTKTWMAMLSGGQNALSSSGLPIDTLNPAHVRTTFATASGSCPLSKQVNANGGADIGFAHYGLSKWGLNAGLNYRMHKVPLSIRINGRASAYRLPGYSGTVRADGSSWSDAATTNTTAQQSLQWSRLYSGSIDLTWQLKMKLNK